eukprot:8045976-Pyramimonas_sp.AAC.1
MASGSWHGLFGRSGSCKAAEFFCQQCLWIAFQSYSLVRSGTMPIKCLIYVAPPWPSPMPTASNGMSSKVHGPTLDDQVF